MYVRCFGRSDCKSEEEFNRAAQYVDMVMLTNQIQFDSNKYGQESIVPQTKIFWIPFNFQHASSVPFKVKKLELSLQDEILNLDWITEI